ncbi:hypothetical protein [Psychromicrobium xiongbiense]|uniref:hypothetical protein n=1 Tax=Psychromicrobium xiongbiense TaxID=3051184 RepID=UPI00255517AA|nr:hypothetical protein [Psychromicrobium sp. YIM S02556]
MSEAIEVDLELESGTVLLGRAFIVAKRGVVTTSFSYSPEYLAARGAYSVYPTAHGRARFVSGLAAALTWVREHMFRSWFSCPNCGRRRKMSKAIRMTCRR